VISTALDPEMKVKKNYQRESQETAAAAQQVPTQKCPKCQQDIPLAEWKEHMRLELMNPKWREEKIKREERAKLQSLATGDEIAANLKRFA
jgi:splicing factor 3A subunit 1